MKIYTAPETELIKIHFEGVFLYSPNSSSNSDNNETPNDGGEEGF